VCVSVCVCVCVSVCVSVSVSVSEYLLEGRRTGFRCAVWDGVAFFFIAVLGCVVGLGWIGLDWLVAVGWTLFGC
jgi:hypothetical protein